jgi:hypothetical protein
MQRGRIMNKKFYYSLFIVVCLPLIALATIFAVKEYGGNEIKTLDKVMQKLDIGTEKDKVILSKEDMIKIGRSIIGFENGIYKIENGNKLQTWLASTYVDPSDYDGEKEELLEDVKKEKINSTMTVIVSGTEKVKRKNRTFIYEATYELHKVVNTNYLKKEIIKATYEIEQDPNSEVYKIKDVDSKIIKESSKKLSNKELKFYKRNK